MKYDAYCNEAPAPVLTQVKGLSVNLVTHCNMQKIRTLGGVRTLRLRHRLAARGRCAAARAKGARTAQRLTSRLRSICTGARCQNNRALGALQQWGRKSKTWTRAICRHRALCIYDNRTATRCKSKCRANDANAISVLGWKTRSVTRTIPRPASAPEFVQSLRSSEHAACLRPPRRPTLASRQRQGAPRAVRGGKGDTS